MFWHKKVEQELLPWYRAKYYKGKMTEKQKRLLDAIRFQDTHPAATYEGLLPEVQSYIGRLELEAYDEKQGLLFWQCALWTFIGGFTLYREYAAEVEASLFSLALGVIFVVAAWIYYSIKFKKNANEYLPSANPNSQTDEALKMEWELEYLSQVVDRESEE